MVVSVNGGSTLSSDVEDFKAVIWWYDKRHEDNLSIDNIDLELATTGGTALKSSLDPDDEKEMVYHSSVGGKAVELLIQGTDVTADGAGCGTNSMRVYYAFFYEDDDRDDTDGPDNTTIERENHW